MSSSAQLKNVKLAHKVSLEIKRLNAYSNTNTKLALRARTQVPNSISGTCPDNLSDDETCSFSCANGYTVPEDQAPAQIDCDNSQLIVERGSCVLQSCVLTSTRSDPLEISQQLQGSNVDGIMEIRCLGDMICTVTCDSGYFNEDPDLSMRCGKDSQDQGLLIMESSLPATFCT